MGLAGQQMADAFGRQLRSPITHSPSEENLDYEDVTFRAVDGVPDRGPVHPCSGIRQAHHRQSPDGVQPLPGLQFHVLPDGQ
jgi:uncharacterized protein